MTPQEYFRATQNNEALSKQKKRASLAGLLARFKRIKYECKYTPNSNKEMAPADND